MSNIVKKYSLVIIYLLVLIFSILMTFGRSDIDDYKQLVYFMCVTLMFFALMLLWHSININTSIHFIRLISLECLSLVCVFVYFVFNHNALVMNVSFSVSFAALLFLSYEFNCYENFLLGKNRYSAYIEKGFIVFISLIIISLIINLFHPFIYMVSDDYLLLYEHIYIYTAYVFSADMVFFLRVFFSNKSKREKFVVSSFILMPVLVGTIMLIFSSMDRLTNIEILSLRASELVSLYLIYFNIHFSEQKKNMEMKEALISSQIGPHFLYNSLATISCIAENEGSLKGSEAINKFADYLRMNIDSIKNNRLITFDKELEHIKTYLWLEQIRFGEDLNVVYDIDVIDFMLPPLTIQPLVENAVNHGVLKKKHGGTVKISTKVVDKKIVITVEDDGVGFKYDDTEHFGIYNIRERIKNIVDGQLIIDSEIDKGTIARVII